MSYQITRTELVWPGKYDDEGNLMPPRRVNLPFQVIERVNETRATREQRQEELAGHVGTLFDYWQAEEEQMAGEGDGWRNKLIWGDNLYVMGSLLEHFAGKIDLIYIDPPFATGADFSFRAQLGDIDVAKEQSAIEEKVYRDTWGSGLDSYMQMLYGRLILMKELLAPSGAIFVHTDYHVGQYIRTILDEIFGERNFRNEIIWWYYNKFQGNVKHFARDHDNIFYYVKSLDGFHFKPVTAEREKPVRQIKRRWDSEKGMLVNVKDENGRVVYQEVHDYTIDDVWRIPMLQPADRTENTGYPTQKRTDLVEIMAYATVPEDGLVADFFCGSGTTCVVAERTGRRWIGCDLSRFGIHTARKRLMDIPDCRPFEILNLGQYERQVWQGVTFGGQKRPQQMLIFDYLKFILKLYGAEPLAGMEHLHGKKGNAVVHVGAVDAPVTIDEVLNCLEECQAAKQKELHVLGWEWEMGLNGLMTGEAKARGIKLLMLHIPREVMEPQAVEKGDIRFFELAYLEAEIKPSRKKRSYTVALTDFVIPNTELIPEEVRQKVRKWSDYVDYWAVDWNFQNDTFVNQWTSYRTRRDRSLQLKTDPHTYDQPGTYNILVKVIDIFGIDTSQVFQVEVE